MLNDFFVDFNKIRVIINVIEIFINNFNNVNVYSFIFFSYKNKNILKVKVGCILYDNVSYILDVYCGFVSVR